MAKPMTGVYERCSRGLINMAFIAAAKRTRCSRRGLREGPSKQAERSGTTRRSAAEDPQSSPLDEFRKDLLDGLLARPRRPVAGCSISPSGLANERKVINAVERALTV